MRYFCEKFLKFNPIVKNGSILRFLGKKPPVLGFLDLVTNFRYKIVTLLEKVNIPNVN